MLEDKYILMVSHFIENLYNMKMKFSPKKNLLIRLFEFDKLNNKSRFHFLKKEKIIVKSCREK